MLRTARKAKLEARGEGSKSVKEKLEPKELRSRLFDLFSKKDVYMVKELNRELQQSEVRVCMSARRKHWPHALVRRVCAGISPSSHGKLPDLFGLKRQAFLQVYLRKILRPRDLVFSRRTLSSTSIVMHCGGFRKSSVALEKRRRYPELRCSTSSSERCRSMVGRVCVDRELLPLWRRLSAYAPRQGACGLDVSKCLGPLFWGSRRVFLRPTLGRFI